MSLRQEGYWDEHYELELKNYEEHGDEGEVWFGLGLRRRIVDWLSKRLVSTMEDSPTIMKIVDIGCGNAFTIYTLAEKCTSNPIGDLTKISECKFLGLDYSSNSIDLSRKIVTAKDLTNVIDLKQCDFLDLEQVGSCCGGDRFDFAVDIGTYDAICLLATESTIEETRLKYMESLYSIVKSGSILILASCNHTEEELLCLFNIETPKRIKSELIGRIDTPNIQFGGKSGSQVACLIVQFTG